MRAGCTVQSYCFSHMYEFFHTDRGYNGYTVSNLFHLICFLHCNYMAKKKQRVERNVGRKSRNWYRRSSKFDSPWIISIFIFLFYLSRFWNLHILFYSKYEKWFWISLLKKKNNFFYNKSSAQCTLSRQKSIQLIIRKRFIKTTFLMAIRWSY